MTDKKGVSWASLKDVKLADCLRTDAGFECIEEGARVMVRCDEGGLYFNCREGHHYLSGQLDAHGKLVGLYPA